MTLKENTDFVRTYYRGKSIAKPALVVYAKKNSAGFCRVGITTSKKIGNAVERNRSRRVIRAAYQSVLSQDLIQGNWDLVFVARGKTKFLKSTVIEEAMISCLQELGVIK
ncbi:MAG: ribonuclease P protein component [Acutalibacteraceae bacterium]|nr:ribonuclease P protein component [Oscillospiraceae bacterium]